MPRKITPAKARGLRALARRIDAEEAPRIRARGKVIFQEHDRLRGVVDTLKAERLRQGLSLADLAERTGIAKPNLSRLENASTSPTFETLQRYAHALGKAVRIEVVNAPQAA